MSILTAPPNVANRVAEPELSQEERQREIWDFYEQEVMKAVESDTWIQGTPEFWEKLRQEARERREARKLSAGVMNQ